MVKIAKLFVLCFLLVVSCINKSPENPIPSSGLDTINDLDDVHEILKILYETDQEERRREKIDYSKMSRNDKKWLRKAKELLKDSSQFSALDYSRAAMLFQHGGATKEYKTAIELMEKAIKLDSTINQWLYFAATDRYLMSMNKPQLFATQHIGKVIESMDTTEKADSIRNSYKNLPSRIKMDLINLKLISEDISHIKKKARTANKR